MSVLFCIETTLKLLYKRLFMVGIFKIHLKIMLSRTFTCFSKRKLNTPVLLPSYDSLENVFTWPIPFIWNHIKSTCSLNILKQGWNLKRNNYQFFFTFLDFQDRTGPHIKGCSRLFLFDETIVPFMLFIQLAVEMQTMFLNDQSIAFLWIYFPEN